MLDLVFAEPARAIAFVRAAVRQMDVAVWRDGAHVRLMPAHGRPNRSALALALEMGGTRVL